MYRTKLSRANFSCSSLFKCGNNYRKLKKALRIKILTKHKEILVAVWKKSL